LNDVAAVPACNDAKLEAVQKERTIEAAARERIRVGQQNAQPLQLLGGCGKLDLRAKRLIQG
jgi:hypothetical protein